MHYLFQLPAKTKASILSVSLQTLCTSYFVISLAGFLLCKKIFHLIKWILFSFFLQIPIPAENFKSTITTDCNVRAKDIALAAQYNIKTVRPLLFFNFRTSIP